MSALGHQPTYALQKGMSAQPHVLAAGHRTPIIIMTACPTDALRARVMQKGAVGFLTKPLCQQEL